MALVLADRVKETSTTTGTGNFTLAGASIGYQSFNSAIGSGNTTYYVIEDSTNGDWETGLGTFTSPSTLARTTVYSSSNSGSLVNFSSGTKNVFVDLSATKWSGGKLNLANGGTNADLSATGGTSQVLQQTSAGGSVTVGQLAASNLSNGTTGTGSVVLSAAPTLTGNTSVGTINNLTITNSTGTLTITNGKTLSANNSLTFAGTDSTTMTFPSASVNVGYLEIPQNAQTGSYTAVLADSGKHIYHDAGAATATYTINSNANVAYPVGTTLTFINYSTNNVTIAITTDTLVLSPGGSTGSRTLTQYGIATAIKITSTVWLISGTGLT